MKTLGKPESNSDVLNKHPTTLLIGYGWVNQFIGKYFTEAHWVDEKGIYYRVSDNKRVKPLDKYELGFIAVPTPMLDSGKCDTSIVEAVVKSYASKVMNFCCKSTVEVGTIDRLSYENKINICFSPEYIGETLGHPLLEPSKNTFIILGGNKKITKVFADAWTMVTNSYSTIFQVSGKCAELCKLMENSFIAAKVMFCNEFFDLANSIGVDYNELREIWLADPRVGRSHTYVYDHNRGFSGKCLPKDINNLVWYFDQNHITPKLMKFLLEYNADLRKDYKNSVPLLPEK
jgi:UDPglucose 6-dehydrogenase